MKTSFEVSITGFRIKKERRPEEERIVLGDEGLKRCQGKGTVVLRIRNLEEQKVLKFSYEEKF